MSGFDLLIEGQYSDSEIKAAILKSFKLDENKAFFYKNIEEILKCKEDVCLQIGMYDKSGDVSRLISLNYTEKAFNVEALEVAKLISTALSSRCFFPSEDSSPSLFDAVYPNGEVSRVRLYESEDGESYKIEGKG